MGRFTEDMGRLRDQIDSDRAQRHTFIADNREAITDAAMAFMADLRTNVETFRTTFRAAHTDMANAAQADRNAFLGRLGSAVADLRSAAAERQAEVRQAFAETTAVARNQREEVTGERRMAVVDMTMGFRDDRARMAAQVQANNQSFVAGVVGAVADIQRQTMDLVNAFGDERASARAAWQRSSSPRATPTAPAAARPTQQKPAQDKAALKSKTAKANPPREEPVAKHEPPAAQGSGTGPAPRDPEPGAMF